MKDLQFTAIDSLGQKKVYDVIATYHHEENNKDYIVYTDRTFDEFKKLKIYYSLYKKEKGAIKLINITSNEDKKIGLELIKELLADINNLE